MTRCFVRRVCAVCLCVSSAVTSSCSVGCMLTRLYLLRDFRVLDGRIAPTSTAPLEYVES